jgi:hypothetical protein
VIDGGEWGENVIGGGGLKNGVIDGGKIGDIVINICHPIENPMLMSKFGDVERVRTWSSK